MRLNEIAIKNDFKKQNEVSKATSVSPSIEPAFEVDLLAQFRANLQQVEDLNLRLRFVLNEVSQVLKKR